MVTRFKAALFHSKATQYLPRTWHSPTLPLNGSFGGKRNSVLLGKRSPGGCEFAIFARTRSMMEYYNTSLR